MTTSVKIWFLSAGSGGDEFAFEVVPDCDWQSTDNLNIDLCSLEIIDIGKGLNSPFVRSDI